MADAQRLWIGGYPPDGVEGSGEGIWQVTLDPAAGTLGQARFLAATPSPTFLAVHPQGHTLYAVAEIADGLVSAFRVEADGGLTALGTCSSGGAQPCHVVATADALHVANYGDGVFTVVPLAADGSFDGPPRTFAHSGSGPDPERQEQSHAHFSGAVAGAQDNAETWVADLGTDELRRFLPTCSAPAGAGVRLPAGAGPRHFVAVDGAVIVATELDAGVVVLAPAGPDAQVVERHPASGTVVEGERNYPSHIALDASGTRLHVAVRGADVLSTFALAAPGHGSGTRLRHLADTPVGGRWPRHFAVVADLVVVANQYSSELVVLRIAASGAGEVVGRLAHPAPACVLPV